MDHPLKQRFVLDTSAFLTDEIRREDEGAEEAVDRLLDLVAEARLELNISCYHPPSIRKELETMLRDRDVDEEIYRQLNSWVIKKDPARYEVMIPSELVYDFVDEMSDRVNRGLRVSEEAVRKAEEHPPGGDVDEKTEVDEVITDLRRKYRDALRQGVLDSREDFDLLVLARELDACVVTEDQGIIDWAGDFGLRHMQGRDFPGLIEEYLDAVE